MTTDDAPRPALDAAAVAEARAMLETARAVDVPWWEHANASSRLGTWLTEHAEQLLAAAAERDALAREAVRLRRAVVLALDGPSDGEIGMETTLGRLNRIERQLRAALAPQEGATDGR